MANNDLYDWTNFTDSESGLELLNNSVRESLKADAYAGRTKFVAVALTNLFPLDAVQAMGLDGASTSTVSGVTSNKRFAFKARILGDKSPHLFLPNPCDPAYATNQDGAWSIISLHTTFLTEETDEPPSVTKGDIVHVELEKSNATIYNLQYGKFKALGSVEDFSSAAAGADFCGLLSSLFDQESSTLGAAAGLGGITPSSAAPCPSCNSPVSATWRINSAYYFPNTCRRLADGDGARYHCGIDLNCAKNNSTELYAIFDGTVTKAITGCNTSCYRGKCPSGCGSGNQLWVTSTTADPKSGKPVIAIYKHMYSVAVGKGTAVTAGQPIGKCGTTGYSSGQHLHFEVHVGSKSGCANSVDPCAYLGRGSCQCTSIVTRPGPPCKHNPSAPSGRCGAFGP